MRSPGGFLGIPRRVGLPPFRGSCWGFRGGFDFWALLGCVWPACPMCIRHSVGLEHSCSSRPGRSREARTLVFSMARLSTQFLLRPPYTRLWDRIPRVLWDTLADESISPRQTDGGAAGPDVPAPWHGRGGEAAGRGTSPPIRSTPETVGHSGGPGGPSSTDGLLQRLVASAAGRLPQPLSVGDLADLWDSLWLLLMAAADGKLSENFSPLENEWDRQDQLRWFSRDDPPPLQQPELLKWRHWRPGKIREMEPTTQRALELHMRGKWAERLLAHFAPFAEHIAYMQDILGEDFRKEALDLLEGQHCLVYESLRKRGFTVIPWQERHVRSLLNQLADEEVTPCKLRQVWNTLKWFSKTFGLLKIDELHRLKSKKSSLEEALTDTVTRPQRKAVVPSKEVIWALEEGAGYDSLGATGPGTQEAPGKNRHGVRTVPGGVQCSLQ